MVVIKMVNFWFWISVFFVFWFGLASSFIYADEKIFNPIVEEKKESRTTLTGMVKNHKIEVKEAFYVWNKGADDLSLFITNNSRSCELLKENILPKNSATLSIVLKHNTKENQDLPFAKGVYPLRIKEKERKSHTSTKVI